MNSIMRNRVRVRVRERERLYDHATQPEQALRAPRLSNTAGGCEYGASRSQCLAALHHVWTGKNVRAIQPAAHEKTTHCPLTTGHFLPLRLLKSTYSRNFIYPRFIVWFHSLQRFRNFFILRVLKSNRRKSRDFFIIKAYR